MSDFTFLRQHWAEAEQKERPEREALAHQNMKKINHLVAEMRNDGWREICYCPKDRSMFWAWCPLSGLPFKCQYEGEWPTGKWWAYCDGDMWPARPVLFKLMAEKTAKNAKVGEVK